MHRYAKEFSSPEALKEYLRKHPNADKSKHTVVDEDTARLKKDLKQWQGIEKGQEKSKKQKAERSDAKGRKEDKAEFDKLKKELEDWRDAK